MLRRSITNVERHANADTVHVQLNIDRGEVELRIIDDGIGFAPDVLATQTPINETFGLRGMHERAAAINAQLVVASHVGEGTVVTCISKM